MHCSAMALRFEKSPHKGLTGRALSWVLFMILNAEKSFDGVEKGFRAENASILTWSRSVFVPLQLAFCTAATHLKW